MNDPNDDLKRFQERIDETEKQMRDCVINSLDKNSKDWIAAHSCSAHFVGSALESAQNPENDGPQCIEFLAFEIGKLQWIQMQILNELRKLNEGK